MRCEVYNCESNNDGYCCVSDYVEIESDGTCSEMYIRTIIQEQFLKEVKND